MTFTLIPPNSFSLPAVVRSHGWIQMSPFSETANKGLSYIIRLNTGKVLRFEVHASGSGLRVDSTEILTTP